MRRSWLALVACEACLFPSLDGLSSADGGGSDAADATLDVGADASDAADSGDAIADAGAPFCAAHPSAVFCDDFDDASALSPAWTVVSVAGDASSFAFVQDAPVSAPNAARSTVAANANNGQAFIG